MANPWVIFGQLTAGPPKLIADVGQHNGDGTSTVTLVGGGAQLRVDGQSVAVGQRAYVQDGAVIGAAPNLPVVTVDV